MQKCTIYIIIYMIRYHIYLMNVLLYIGKYEGLPRQFSGRFDENTIIWYMEKLLKCYKRKLTLKPLSNNVNMFLLSGGVDPLKIFMGAQTPRASPHLSTPDCPH